MSGHFTIRPKPMPWESLTGYMIRVSRLNQVSLNEVMRHILNPSYQFAMRLTYHLDVFPDSIFDMKRLEVLTGLSQEKLFSMSMMPIHNKLYEDSDSPYKLALLLNKKARFICPKCLKKDGVFKLVWQIEGITICDIHHEKLRGSCSKCGSEYPYLSKKYTDQACPTCDSEMTEHPDGVLPEQEEVEEQLFWYEVWRYVLQTQNQLVNVLEGYSKEESAVITLLWGTPWRGHLSSEQPDITKGEVYSVISSLRNKKRRITIHSLMNILRNFGISLEQFAHMEVPLGEISSLLPQNPTRKKELGPCLAPWCSSFGKNIAMKPASRKTKVQHYSICTDCFMHYGFGRKDGVWQEVRGDITFMLNDVRPLLETSYKVREMREKLGKHELKICRAIGYLSHRKILSEHACKKYIPKILETDVLKCFQKMIEQSISEETLLKLGRSMFGWRRREFYYYFSYPEVQELLEFGDVRKKDGHENLERTRREKVKRVIEDCLRNGEEITFKKITALIGLSEATMYSHGFDRDIAEARKNQKAAMVLKEIDNIKNQIRKYLDEKEQSRSVATQKEVYDFLGMSVTQFKTKYSDLKEWFDQQMGEHSAKRHQYQLEKHREVVMEALRFFNENLMSVTIRKVLEHANLVEPSIRKRYPEIIELIKLNGVEEL